MKPGLIHQTRPDRRLVFTLDRIVQMLALALDEDKPERVRDLIRGTTKADTIRRKISEIRSDLNRLEDRLKIDSIPSLSSSKRILRAHDLKRLAARR